MLVVASGTELHSATRVWGADGSLAPEDREALDWLTLARLLGWDVTVTPHTGEGLDTAFSGANGSVVIACAPDALGEDVLGFLASRLAAEPTLVVARAGEAGGAFARLAGTWRGPMQAAGRSLQWRGPGPKHEWSARAALRAGILEGAHGASVWATLEGAPVVVARPVGRGIVATVGFHPSVARDADGAATALLKHLLIWGTAGPVAWLHLEGTLVLRMDDPGGAQNVHLRKWSYPKLVEAEWAAIAEDLKRRDGRMSIGYTPGWVDDGDTERGALEVAGRVPRRIPGLVHPSPLVKYRDLAGHAPGTLHDYAAEFRGIQQLRAAGLGDVELHGFTHMHPDSASWAQAPDRYEAKSWYRELGSSAEAASAARPPREHPLALAVGALQRYFHVHPTTLISPGHQWTAPALERALDMGLHLVSTDFLALRHGEQFCWTTHVRTHYLDEPTPAAFGAGLPVVGFFHDRDPALEGVDWIRKCLDQWAVTGARRLVDFRELAAAVGRRLSLENDNGALVLRVRCEGAPPLVRPLPVAIRLPGGEIPSRVSALLDEGELSLEAHPCGDAVGCVDLPCSPPRNRRVRSGPSRTGRGALGVPL